MTLDLIGQKYGRLTIVKNTGKRQWHNVIWLCECSCDGKLVEVKSGNMRSGDTRSCGCLQKENGHKQLDRARTTKRIKAKKLPKVRAIKKPKLCSMAYCVERTILHNHCKGDEDTRGKKEGLCGYLIPVGKKLCGYCKNDHKRHTLQQKGASLEEIMKYSNHRHAGAAIATSIILEYKAS